MYQCSNVNVQIQNLELHVIWGEQTRVRGENLFNKCLERLHGANISTQTGI